MTPARPYRKGNLKLSLGSCRIALKTGTSSTKRLSSRQINGKASCRLRQQFVDEVTCKPLEGEDEGRGYECAKSAGATIDMDELDAVAIDSGHTVNTYRIKDQDNIEIADETIDDVDRALNPMGRFYRHNAMHAATTPMVLDEFGRCLKCLKLGFWKADA